MKLNNYRIRKNLETVYFLENAREFEFYMIRQQRTPKQNHIER